MEKRELQLQSVRKWREYQRQSMIQALASLESEMDQTRRNIEQIQQERDSLHDFSRESREGELSVDRLLEFHRYELQLRETQDSLRLEHEKLMEKSNMRRSKLVEADLELKKIEQLIDRRQEIIDRTDRQQELKIMDEFSTQRIRNR
ncbi:MAG: flagellar FliJ family protein [Planctomycetota bacterium]|jgi:flagellar FliJ protein|nr:flagellar FliJ family protein [Planctomycetota bacterium]